METDPGPAKGRFSILSKTFSLPAVVYKEFLEAPERNPTLRPTGSFMGFGFFPFPAAFCPVVLIGVRPLEFMGYRDLGSQPLELSPFPPQIPGGFAEPGFCHFPEIQGKSPQIRTIPAGKGLVWSGSPRSCQRRFPSVPRENWDNRPLFVQVCWDQRENPMGSQGKVGVEGMGMGTPRVTEGILASHPNPIPNSSPINPTSSIPSQSQFHSQSHSYPINPIPIPSILPAAAPGTWV